jgi:mannose/fructose/N-acetylgalactosamine-specific phosphotransferase system component IIB
VASLKDLRQLVFAAQTIKTGYVFPGSVNIGGLRHSGNKKQIYSALCIDLQDIALMNEIMAAGVRLEYYLLPNDPRIDLNGNIKDLEAVVSKG